MRCVLAVDAQYQLHADYQYSEPAAITSSHLLKNMSFRCRKRPDKLGGGFNRVTEIESLNTGRNYGSTLLRAVPILGLSCIRLGLGLGLGLEIWDFWLKNTFSTVFVDNTL
jgi:hypothetical protein